MRQQRMLANMALIETRDRAADEERMRIRQEDAQKGKMIVLTTVSTPRPLIYVKRKLACGTRSMRLGVQGSWIVVYLSKQMAQKYDLPLSLLPPNCRRQRQYLLQCLLRLQMSLRQVLSNERTMPAEEGQNGIIKYRSICNSQLCRYSNAEGNGVACDIVEYCGDWKLGAKCQSKSMRQGLEVLATFCKGLYTVGCVRCVWLYMVHGFHFIGFP